MGDDVVLLPGTVERLTAQGSCHAVNQCSTVTYRQRWKEALRGADLVVVVQNTSRWPSEPTQRYALCLMLETDENVEPLYDELQVRFEALSELEIELES